MVVALRVSKEWTAMVKETAQLVPTLRLAEGPECALLVAEVPAQVTNSVLVSTLTVGSVLAEHVRQ